MARGVHRILGTSIGAGWTGQVAYDRIVETTIGAVVGMGGVVTISLVRRYAARLRDPDDHEVTVLRYRGLP